MSDKINKAISQEEESSAEKPKSQEEESKTSPENIQMDFQDHNALKGHLKSCDESEREKLIDFFFNSNRADKHWEDLIQRGFLGYFCDIKDEENAKRVVELCLDPRSQEGRIQKYNAFFGKYEGKLAEIIKAKITDEEREILNLSFEIDSTSKFREALDLGLMDVADAWIKFLERIGKYKNLNEKEFNDFIRDRKRELRKAKEKVEAE